MSNELKNIEDTTYTQVKTELERLITTGIPNIKAFERELRSIKKRMEAVAVGVCFAVDMEEVDKAERAMARLKGRRRAFKDVLTYIKNKIKEYENETK